MPSVRPNHSASSNLTISVANEIQQLQESWSITTIFPAALVTKYTFKKEGYFNGIFVVMFFRPCLLVAYECPRLLD
jgi:exosortase/archaeosortase